MNILFLTILNEMLKLVNSIVIVTCIMYFDQENVGTVNTKLKFD